MIEVYEEKEMVYDDPLIDPKTEKPLTKEQLKALAALGDRLIELQDEADAKRNASNSQADS